MISRTWKQLGSDWSFWAIAAGIILFGGFAWSCIATHHYQQIEGFSHLPASPRWAHYEFWALTVPLETTLWSATVCLVIAAIQLLGNKFIRVTALLMYSLVLGATYIVLYTFAGF